IKKHLKESLEFGQIHESPLEGNFFKWNWNFKTNLLILKAEAFNVSNIEQEWNKIRSIEIKIDGVLGADQINFKLLEDENLMAITTIGDKLYELIKNIQEKTFKGIYEPYLSKSILEIVGMEKDEISKNFENMDNKFDDINKNFKDINKNIEGINKNFEDINKNFEGINKNFEGINTNFKDKFDIIEKKFADMDKNFMDKFDSFEKKFANIEEKFTNLIEEKNKSNL
ncbi:3944_t:CDS:2, partial [Racocetra fulgida]